MTMGARNTSKFYLEINFLPYSKHNRDYKEERFNVVFFMELITVYCENCTKLITSIFRPAVEITLLKLVVNIFTAMLQKETVSDGQNIPRKNSAWELLDWPAQYFNDTTSNAYVQDI